jgi:hypothetical protein
MRLRWRENATFIHEDRNEIDETSHLHQCYNCKSFGELDMLREALTRAYFIHEDRAEGGRRVTYEILYCRRFGELDMLREAMTRACFIHEDRAEVERIVTYEILYCWGFGIFTLAPLMHCLLIYKARLPDQILPITDKGVLT